MFIWDLALAPGEAALKAAAVCLEGAVGEDFASSFLRSICRGESGSGDRSVTSDCRLETSTILGSAEVTGRSVSPNFDVIKKTDTKMHAIPQIAKKIYFIIEFKKSSCLSSLENDSSRALNQILSKNYMTDLPNYEGLLIGVSFHKKMMAGLKSVKLL